VTENCTKRVDPSAIETKVVSAQVLCDSFVTSSSVEGVPCEMCDEVILLVACGSSTVLGIQIMKLLVM
jgi:hypothetical protein